MKISDWKDDSEEESDEAVSGEEGSDSSDHEEQEGHDSDEEDKHGDDGPKIYKNKKRGGNKWARVVLILFRQFKTKVQMSTGEHMITEKNEHGDYKVKALYIKQLEKDEGQEDLNKSVS